MRGPWSPGVAAAAAGCGSQRLTKYFFRCSLVAPVCPLFGSHAANDASFDHDDEDDESSESSGDEGGGVGGPRGGGGARGLRSQPRPRQSLPTALVLTRLDVAAFVEVRVQGHFNSL